MRAFEILLVLGLASFQGSELRHAADALLTTRNGAYAGTGAALAAVAYSGRDDLHDDLRGAWYIDRPSDVTDVYGSGSFNLPVALGLSATGRLVDRPHLRRLGDGLARTLTLTHLVVSPIKLASRRRRPDESDRYSFPSGHSANTFAVARYLQIEYGTRAALLPYALAVTTAAGRMEGGRHYLSDVIMGATVGILAGSAAGRDGPTNVRVAAMEGGAGVMARLVLD